MWLLNIDLCFKVHRTPRARSFLYILRRISRSNIRQAAGTSFNLQEDSLHLRPSRRSHRSHSVGLAGTNFTEFSGQSAIMC